MSTMLNAYMTENEATINRGVARDNIEFRKLTTMYEMVNIDLEMKMENAEDKVFAESGNYDDLELAYMEAVEEAGEKKKNIIQKIIDFIMKQIGKLKSLFTKNNLKDPNETVEVEKSFMSKIPLIGKLWDALKDSVAKIKSGNINGIGDVASVCKPILASIAAVSVGGAVVTVSVKKLLQHRKNIEDSANECEEAMKGAQSLLGKVKGGLDKVGENGGSVGSAIKKVGDAGINKLEKALAWIKNYITEGNKLTSWINSKVDERKGKASAKISEKNQKTTDKYYSDKKKKVDTYNAKNTPIEKVEGDVVEEESANDYLDIFGYAFSEDDESFFESADDSVEENGRKEILNILKTF